MNVNESIAFLMNLGVSKYKLEIYSGDYHKFVKGLFQAIAGDKFPIQRLQEKRDKLKRDYEDISKPYVRGESYGGTGGGTPINSYHVSMIDNIHIERFKIEEEISRLAIEQRILEEQLKTEFEAFEILSYSLKNRIIGETLILTFLYGLTLKEISKKLNYPEETIKRYRWMGIKEIAEIIEQKIPKK